MLIYIVFAVLLLAEIYFAVAYACFLKAFTRRKTGEYTYHDMSHRTHFSAYMPQIAEGQEWLLDNTRENYEITSFDGLTLSARYIPAENEKALILMFHGYHSSTANDFACFIKKYHDMGYSVLLTDQRSHNRSEGRYITFGTLERSDCISWIFFAMRTFGKDTKVFLHGLSMGATTVMLALTMTLPENVRGIIADCGFTSPYEIVGHTVKQQYKVSPGFILPAVNIICKKLAGFNMREVDTRKALAKSKLPILIIHGNDDTFVPTYMSHENFAASASEKKMLLLVDGAYHGMSYLLEPERYENTVREFLAENE